MQERKKYMDNDNLEEVERKLKELGLGLRLNEE